MAQPYCSLVYHVVLCTNQRRSLLHGEVALQIHEYLGGAVRDAGGSAIVINGTENHVHLLVQIRPDKAVSDFVRNLKTNSSAWIHRTFTNLAKFAWQAGYGAFTVSPSHVEKVKRYILNQEEQHNKMSFQEEYIQLLRVHGIEFDEKHLWD